MRVSIRGVLSLAICGLFTAGSMAADIVDTAVGAGKFATKSATLGAVDLAGTLKGEGPFTVFAPTGEAFAKLVTTDFDASNGVIRVGDNVLMPTKKEANARHVVEKVGAAARPLDASKLHKSEKNKTAKSIHSKHRTMVVFHNNSEAIRKLYWLDFTGKRKLYKELPSGETHVQVTFLTHPWLVTDSHDRPLDIYYPDKKARRVVLGKRTTPQPAIRHSVNGWSVTEAKFGHGKVGRKLGTYRQMGNRKWREVSASPHGTNFNFNEVNRDEWSVYLHDPSRDVRIQIDLHTRKIYYSDAHSPRRELYSIQSSSAKASGWSVTQANFGFGKTRLGTFRQTGDRKWRETSASPDGNNFNFNEVNRDEWSVYLHDPSRDVRIQIDLHTRKIYYSDANTPRRKQYQVLNASAKANGWVALGAYFGHGARKLGRYVQTGTGKWKEIPKSPDGTTFHFNETNRDMWSVYLHDPSRNVRIQIDLHTRKIYYSDPQAPKREQYQVLSAWAS